MTLLQREIILLWRQRSAVLQLWVQPLLLLFVAGLFAPVTGIGQDVATLLLLFVMLLVMTPLSSRLWHDDLQSGVLEQIYLYHGSLLKAVAARFAAYFCFVLMPILLLALGARWLWLGVPVAGAELLAYALLAATVLALTQLAAALIVNVQYGALLLGLLLVPFMLPAFIAFAAIAAVPAALYLLAAAAVLAVPLGTMATSAILRQQLCV